MRHRLFVKTVLTGLTLLFYVHLYSQGRVYEGPDDPASDPGARRMGQMNGNRISETVQNNTEIGNWNQPGHAIWPNDQTGQNLHDNIYLCIGARVFLENKTAPVTDLVKLAGRTDLDTLWFVQTHSRDDGDYSPDGTIKWGFHPVFGYFNENNEYPAMSNIEQSWPPQGWPSRGDELKWPGEWNGRFGRGIAYADMECYFVANDAQDQEYLQDNLAVKYYPRPGVKIGDKRPQVTKQKGRPWGGLGLRVEQRGLQWNNPQARDAIFWEYSISNGSDYDIHDMVFGYTINNGIGNDGPEDDIGYFDRLIDMAYVWDIDGIGLGGLRTPTMGIAFLESPGVGWDGVDNDDDGLVDEKRDNQATAVVGPFDGISDLGKFKRWYNVQESALKPHWDADEDQDWNDGEDKNGNGIYDAGEYLGDDVGLDGVGPGDLNYDGPDADGTECNHKPDFLEGYGCEPDFAVTDISESDMLGLTAFRMYECPSNSSPKVWWMRNDKIFYKLMTEMGVEAFTGEVVNLIQMFASGTFPLYKGRTERISMAQMCAYEEVSGLNSSAHKAPALFEKKNIVQMIYEADYRFAQPPVMPELKATAMDGQVMLRWDDRADKLSREPMLGNINDFEGYKLYRSTDKRFADAERLRDVYGNPAGKIPIFQCDVKNGRRGPTNYGMINGEPFYLGEDSGIRHYYIDKDVQNGRTYYYALVAYDYGIPPQDITTQGIGPAENNVVVDIDEYDQIRYYGKNVQIVTPRQEAAGYQTPGLEVMTAGPYLGSGSVQPELVDESGVKGGHVYKVKFDVDTLGHINSRLDRRAAHDVLYVTEGLSVYDVTAGDSLVYRESSGSFPEQNLQYVEDENYWYYNIDQEVRTEVFDGLRLVMRHPVREAQYWPERSGWVKGNSPMTVTSSVNESRYLPYEYEIIYTAEKYKTRCNMLNRIKNQENVSLGTADLLAGEFNFYVVNKSFMDGSGAYEVQDLVIWDVNKNKKYDSWADYILVGPVVASGTSYYWGGTVFSVDYQSVPSEQEMPKAGDVYRVNYQRPFYRSDSLVFSVKGAVELDTEQLAQDMDRIKVVPNPYVATNAMEPALMNYQLNQRRRLMFTHVPAQSEIRIYTSSGVFVDGIQVENEPGNGVVHWDMLTREGLEIASGLYIFHVKSKRTGDEKLGKFYVIK
jgi:hypothetical protein